MCLNAPALLHAVTGDEDDVFMLTADVALLEVRSAAAAAALLAQSKRQPVFTPAQQPMIRTVQDEKYLELVKLFAEDQKELDDTFSRTWCVYLCALEAAPCHSLCR
jgi:hypothetical protein